MSERYERKKQMGLCVECGNPRGESPTLTCAKCRASRKARNRVFNALAQKKRQENRAKGLCACGAQPQNGRKTCRNCYLNAKIIYQQKKERQKEGGG